MTIMDAREATARVPDPDHGEAIVQNVVPKFSATQVRWIFSVSK
ncbi:MAG: hypothetical protein WCH75_18785 [Candidatus Binatia bacterium]